MEFNDLVTLILLFVFFVLPAIFKRRSKKKRAVEKKTEVKKKKPGLFDRLGDAVNTFVRELEKQALEAKKKTRFREQGTVWEEMDDREQVLPEGPAAGPFVFPDGTASEPVRQTLPPEKPGAHTSKTAFERQKERKVPTPEVLETRADRPAAARGRTNLPAHELQRAVVWSEILGKPVALRDG